MPPHLLSYYFFKECIYACVSEEINGNSGHKQMLKKAGTSHSHTIFPLRAFPASNYLQPRGFPDLLLTTA